MPISLGDIVLFFRGDTDDVDQAFDRVESKAESWASRMGSFIGGALQTATGMLVASAAENAWDAIKGGLIDTNAELESATLQFQTLMGDADAAQAHVKDLFTFAAKTPFESGPVIEASRYMETFGGAALDTNENLTLLGDAAAATGNKINEVGFWASRAYDAIQSGRPFGESAARLQEMGILSGQARQHLEDMQKSGASGQEVWAAFTQELQKFNGAMLLQANTWQGLTSSFADIVNINLAQVMRPLFDLMKEGLSSVNNLLSSPAGEAFVQSATDAVQRVADGVRSLAADAQAFWAQWGPTITQAWDVFVSGATRVAEGARLVAGVLGELIGEALGWAGQFIAPISEAINTTIADFEGMGGGILGALGNAEVVVEDFFLNLLASATDWGDGMVAAYAEGIAGAIGYVVDALGGIGDTIADWLTPHSPPKLLPDLDQWGTDAANVYLGAWDKANFDALSGFGDGIKGLLDNLVSSGSLGAGQSAGMQAALRNQFANILSSVQTTGQVSQEQFAEIAAAAGPAGAQVAQLAQQYVGLAQASRAASQAQAELKQIDSELREGQAELAIARASGNSALAAEARDRINMLRQRRTEAQQKQAAAQRDQSAIQQQLQVQQLMLQAQKEQLALLKQVNAEQTKKDKSAKSAKSAADKAADAQWQYNYAMADQQGKVDLLTKKLETLKETDAEYWSTKQQLASAQNALDEKRKRDADKAAKEAKQRADQEFNYQMELADTAGQVELLRKKKESLKETDEDYYPTLIKLQQAEERLEKERERAAKKKGKGGAGGGGPGAPKREDPVAKTKEEIEEAKRKVQERIDAAKRAAEEEERKVKEAAGRVKRIIGDWAAGIGEVLRPVTSAIGGAVREGLNIAAGMFGGNEIASAVGQLFTTVSTVVQERLAVFKRIFLAGFDIGNTLATVFGPSMMKSFNSAFASLITNASTIFGSVQRVVTQVFGFIATFLEQNGDSIASTIGTAWNLIMSIISGVASVLGTIVQGAFLLISDFLRDHGDLIMGILQTAWNTISTVVISALTVISGIIQTVLAIINGDWDRVWMLLGSTLQAFWTGITTLISGSLELIAGIIRLGWTIISGIFGAAVQGVALVLGSAWDNITESTRGTFDTLLVLITAGLNLIKTTFDTSLALVQTALSTAWESIKTGAGQAMDGVKKAVSSGLAAIPSSITDMVSDFVTFGEDLIKGVIQGIKNMAGAAGDAVRKLIKQALGAGKEEADSHSPSRRFRDELGLTIPQGVQQGIERGAPAATQAMRNMVGDLAGAGAGGVQVPLVGGGAAGVGALAGAGAAGGQTIIEEMNVSFSFPNVTDATTLKDPAVLNDLARVIAEKLQRGSRG